LDKVGITIETETRDIIVQGDQAQIDRLFLRIERYMKIIAGAVFLEYNTVPENIFDLSALMEELEDYNIQPSETLSHQDIQRLVSNNFTDRNTKRGQEENFMDASLLCDSPGYPR
jgi:hypothetical protein